MGSHQDFILSNPSVVGQQIYHSNNGHRKEGLMGNKEGFIGVLEVFIHQARNIHNICIYHKQDVYAKIFLTGDPKATKSTQTINGGGQNPVFNENLKINVRNGDCSLRCEIWMLSRVRNYLEDQLLGFAMVPLSEVLTENGKLEKEFQLSTSELFHSPSGFVKLSITYTGSPPDVLEIPTPPLCLHEEDTCELEKIEFPDLKVMNENEIMVSEYYSKCVEIESQSTANTQTDDSVSSDSNNHLVSRAPKEDLETTSFPKTENNLEASEKKEEQKVVQQEIVDMYLKGMKQFTEALAKMKLPMDKGNNSPDLRGKHSKETNGNGSKGEGPNAKVFYGSRAFF